jgi:hypothetical protein
VTGRVTAGEGRAEGKVAASRPVHKCRDAASSDIWVFAAHILLEASARKTGWGVHKFVLCSGLEVTYLFARKRHRSLAGVTRSQGERLPECLKQ